MQLCNWQAHAVHSSKANNIPLNVAAILVALAGACGAGAAVLGAEPHQTTAAAIDALLTGRFRWIGGPPVLAPLQRTDDFYYSVKDPSVVFFEGRWHIFCTIRGKNRSHQVEYISLADWNDTASAKRAILKLSDGYFCAPQVFFFRPHNKWYMILQVIDQTRRPALQPAFATTEKLTDPDRWSKPVLLYHEQPENVKAWIDFWVICDEQKAHLFFTSLDGQMWRSETALGDFPRRWSQPRVVLRADIFEASHTYRLKWPAQPAAPRAALGAALLPAAVVEKAGPAAAAEKAGPPHTSTATDKRPNYLTIVEAQAPGGRRYYKAYVAQRLEGPWQPLADSLQKPFAAPTNVRLPEPPWTDSFSHGELLRAGYDELLEVEPAQLRLLYQGVSDEDRAGKVYGQIPWRLGLLELDTSQADR